MSTFAAGAACRNADVQVYAESSRLLRTRGRPDESGGFDLDALGLADARDDSARLAILKSASFVP
eukprot:1485190-Pleurochrysis_carterae.AAC.1